MGCEKCTILIEQFGDVTGVEKKKDVGEEDEEEGDMELGEVKERRKRRRNKRKKMKQTSNFSFHFYPYFQINVLVYFCIHNRHHTTPYIHQSKRIQTTHTQKYANKHINALRKKKFYIVLLHKVIKKRREKKPLL